MVPGRYGLLTSSVGRRRADEGWNGDSDVRGTVGQLTGAGNAENAPAPLSRTETLTCP